jgi:predicted DNA-binding transcriptional regulator AlpA
MKPADTSETPTLPDVGERLVGAHEIARMFAVERQTVHDWLKKPERFRFPEPWDQIKAGKVWRTEDVRAWAKKTGREIHE